MSDLPDSSLPPPSAPELVGYRWYTQTEVAELTGFGRDAVARFVDMGLPTVFRKINLDWLMIWLKENYADLQDLKVRSRKGASA